MYAAYSAAWNEADTRTRSRLLERCWADGGALYDTDTPDGIVGRDAIANYIGQTQNEMPGLAITDTCEPEVVAGRLRVAWSAAQGQTVRYVGTDFIEFADDGRISRVTMFDDLPHDSA